MLEDDEDFTEEFHCLYNIIDVPEADNEDFVEEFHCLYDNTDVPEVDNEFDLDTYNTYLNMELAIDMGCHEHPQYAKVTKQLKDHCGNPIGTANNNPILDTRMYKVEFADGSKQALVANIIAENMFASIDKEGHQHLLNCRGNPKRSSVCSVIE